MGKYSVPMEPNAIPEARVLCVPPDRSRHKEHWPEVEVVERVTVIATESWGTRTATYEIVAREPVDIREGFTRIAFEEANVRAHHRINAVRRDIQIANPDYMTPARY